MTRIRPLAQAVVAAALALPALVAGCGTSAAGTAAVVDGRRVTEADVQRATAEIQAFVGPQTAVRQQTVLLFLIASPDLVNAAAGIGKGVSRNDAEVQLATGIQHPSEATVTVWQASRAFAAIRDQAALQQQVTQRVEAHAITVNPRYGTFDPSKLIFTRDRQNWIVTSSASAEPQSAQPSPSAS